MDQKIIKQLTSYGLSENEAKAYAATLALDGGSVDQIAKQADTNRSSPYPVPRQQLPRLSSTSATFWTLAA